MFDTFAPARQRRSPTGLVQLQALAVSESLEQILSVLLANSDTGLDPLRLEHQFNRLRSSWDLPADIRLVMMR